MAITITGANGETVSLADASDSRQSVTATRLQTAINTYVSTGTGKAFDVTPSSGSPTYDSGIVPIAIVEEAGTYSLSNVYQYIVVAEDTGNNTGAVTLNSDGTSASAINILAGRSSGLTYTASDQAASLTNTLVNTTGNLTFNGTGKTGKWVIYTGNGNATVNTTDGNNQINTGSGASTITLGNGNNQVYSQGQDTITASGTGYQSVTLNGGSASVNMNNQAMVLDVSNHNTISVGKNSTISGGTSGTYTFTEGTNNRLESGSKDTISATNGSDLTVIQGSDQTFNVEGKLSFLNGYGDTSITVGGQAEMFGASGSNYTVNAAGSASGLFVADIGNETLNASGSSVGLQIYANTISGAASNFTATGGSGNDIMVGGTGNATFTGGAGNNLFEFIKGTSDNGNTVITDFAKEGSNNSVGLFNYGLTTDSLATLLASSANDSSGNAVLKIDSHTITFEGVSISNLSADKFIVSNTTTA